MPTSALLFAMALLAADNPALGGAAPPAAEPKSSYEFVSWCYGALGGYLDLYDGVMPEVTRIEGAFRAPGRTLAQDLEVYADMRRDGRRQMKVFAAAMEAAERASLRPINTQGAAAVKKGRAVWAPAPNLPKARVAQEWMSWTIPARCESEAVELEKRAKLMGTAFQVETVEAAPVAAPAEAPSLDAVVDGAVPTEPPAEPAAEPVAAPKPVAKAAKPKAPLGLRGRN
ncbi:MAG: hypothetical protein ABW042_10955 [Phenylobacterium sp.]